MTMRLIVFDDGEPGAMPANTFSERTLSRETEEYIRKTLETFEDWTPVDVVSREVELAIIAKEDREITLQNIDGQIQNFAIVPEELYDDRDLTEAAERMGLMGVQ
jgi:hypothetical protein